MESEYPLDGVLLYESYLYSTEFSEAKAFPFWYIKFTSFTRIVVT